MKAFDSNSMAKRLYKKHEDELRTANADLRYGFKDHQVHKGSHREVAWQETSLLPVVEARDQCEFIKHLSRLIDNRLCFIVLCAFYDKLYQLLISSLCFLITIIIIIIVLKSNFTSFKASRYYCRYKRTY